MAQLLLLTNALAPSSEVLPALGLLPHQVRVLPAEAAVLVDAPPADVVVVDGRRDLAGELQVEQPRVEFAGRPAGARLQRVERDGVVPQCFQQRFLRVAVGGVDPAYMGMGPVVAVPKVLAQVGLGVDDLAVIELNEAFASQALAVVRDLGFDPARVNPNGGALAMGHPLGATGAILTAKLLAELERTGGRYGLVTMCVGGGMGAAGVFEQL